MLEPGSRRLLTEALRPPVGYQLDHAVVTTFSLDLLALLLTPLSFALFDWERANAQGSRPATSRMLIERSSPDCHHPTCFEGDSS